MKIKISILGQIKAMTLLVCLLCLGACEQNESQTLLDELDELICKKSKFDNIKEKRIDELRKLHNISNISLEQEYNINQQLFLEFRKYKLDSAIYRLQRNREIAIQLRDSNQLQYCNLHLAQLYSFSGMSIEAERVLSSTPRNSLPRELLSLYYDSYHMYYMHYAAISNQQQYLKDAFKYRDSVIQVIDRKSLTYKLLYQYKQLEQGHIAETEEVLEKMLSEQRGMTHEYAQIAHALGITNSRKSNYKLEKRYYILSAMADIRNSIKENASTQSLALYYYGRGDLQRAFKYTQAAIDDAVFSNGQFRTAQMAKVYSIINASYQIEQAASRTKLKHYLILISVLSVFFVLLFIFALKQVRKLSRIRKALSQANEQLTSLNEEMQEKNLLLSDANIIKKQYIARFFDLCSMYVDKMDNYRKTLYRIAQNRQLEELYKMLKSTSMLEKELEELYKNFDAIFLNIYPTFVADFNALLNEDEQITLKSEDLLNKELRIYALIRLGITDSTKISSFLRCSLSTVYNYRTRARNKSAIPREDFEDLVMRIGVVHKNVE